LGGKPAFGGGVDDQDFFAFEIGKVDLTAGERLHLKIVNAAFSLLAGKTRQDRQRRGQQQRMHKHGLVFYVVQWYTGPSWGLPLRGGTHKYTVSVREKAPHEGGRSRAPAG